MTDTPAFLDFDTDQLAESDQFAAWASAIPAFVPSRRSAGGGFRARSRAWFLSPLVATCTTLDPVRYQRSAALAASDGLDALTVQLMVAGRSRGRAAGHLFKAEPSDILVQDASLPFEATATRTQSVTLTMPRAFLDDRLPGADVHGLVLRGGAARLLSAFMRSLPGTLAELREGSRAALHVPIIARDLLVAALLDLDQVRPQAGRTDDLSGRPLRHRVRRYVAANIADPITVAGLCKAMSVSRAAIYRAFSADGGVMAYVLDARLNRARRLLRDPDGPTIAAISTATGFRDPSDFGRAFRRRFGMTPGSAQRHNREKPTALGSTPTLFRKWVEEDKS